MLLLLELLLLLLLPLFLPPFLWWLQQWQQQKQQQLQQQQHLCLNEKSILIQLNLISIDFVFLIFLQISFVRTCMSDRPTFYVTDTTVTDPSTAPEGSTSLFVLVPISYCDIQTCTEFCNSLNCCFKVRSSCFRIQKGPGSNTVVLQLQAEASFLFTQNKT